MKKKSLKKRKISQDNAFVDNKIKYVETCVNWSVLGRRGHDLMIVRFTIICAISAYRRAIQHYVIKFASDM
jgi:hypothetical protein